MQNLTTLLILLLFAIQLHCTASNQPIRMAILDVQAAVSWQDISPELGIPTRCKPNIYQIFSMKQWDPKGPGATAQAWTLSRYLPSSFGADISQKQRTAKQLYRSENKKLLLRIFGFDNTTILTTSYSASQLAYQAAQFIKANLFDGADILCPDDFSFQSGGDGEAWFINFTLAIRKYLPNHMIIHSVQAKIMRGQIYKNGGYLKINRAVGHLIDFYHVMYYTKGRQEYNTYDELFVNTTEGFGIASSAVGELIMRGIPAQKIVVGRLVQEKQSLNIDSWLVKAYNQLNWSAGVALDRFGLDLNGTIIQTISRPLMNCLEHGDCQVNDR